MAMSIKKMRIRTILAYMLFLITCFWLVGPSAFAASPSATLLKAKQEAEAKGYIFLTSRDEIVAKARKEGQVRVLYGVNPATARGIAEAFAKKYPFINIRRIEESEGPDAAVRIIMELQAGTAAKAWDIVYLSGNHYTKYLAYIAKYDLLGMAEKGVLQIPPQMIDPDHRNVVAAGSALDAIAYNPKLLPAALVPKNWEDLLRPELKGRKFIMDVAPAAVAALAPAWGLKKVLEFARKIREQEPIWGRGHSRMLTSIVAGEYALHGGTNYHSAVRTKKKAPAGTLDVVLAEPVPVRLHETQAILSTAINPHAALLWLEHMASPEAQKYLDEVEPLKSSIFVSGSALKKAVEEKKVSVAAWRSFYEREGIEKQIVEAYGFPSARLK